jgi:hypothetical protein
LFRGIRFTGLVCTAFRGTEQVPEGSIISLLREALAEKIDERTQRQFDENEMLGRFTLKRPLALHPELSPELLPFPPVGRRRHRLLAGQSGYPFLPALFRKRLCWDTLFCMGGLFLVGHLFVECNGNTQEVDLEDP